MKSKKKRKGRRIMLVTLSIIMILVVASVIFLNQPNFGRIPQGERLERIKESPNYRDGRFQNLHETPQITSDKGLIGTMAEFLFKKKERLNPETDLPVIKTKLRQIDKGDDMLVWFGHSSYFIQTDQVRILVDPVLTGAASPVSFINKPFKGTDVYKPEDIPDIDYLIITHDHWDHLDYKTVKELKPRIRKVICGLGVGEHFEYWGFDKDKIIELDWYENVVPDTEFTIYCLPARHFSGRSIFPNKSLWASFLVKTPTRKIFIGGDGGYDTHFAEIGRQFDGIDLAIIENGQYGEDWKYIHLLPGQIAQAFYDLKAGKLITVHNSKYALAYHPWDEPLKNITEIAEKDSINLILPAMGEVVHLNDSTGFINKWWKGID